MNHSPAFARPTRSFLAATVLVAITALAVGWSAGTAAASSGSRSTASPTGGSPLVPGVAVGAPGGNGSVALVQSAGGASVSAGTASGVAYPIPGYGSLGVAPEGTILADGSGTSPMKADGSDRATALKTATDAALADAHARALAAAGAMGVGLKEIYSLSVTSNDSYTYATPNCLVPPIVPIPDQGGPTGPGAAASAVPVPVSPTAICPLQSAQATPQSAQLFVSVVVAYKFG
jgi:hypothetical protein